MNGHMLGKLIVTMKRKTVTRKIIEKSFAIS